MRKKHGVRRQVLLVVLAGSLAPACSFDPDLPDRSGNAAPASGVMLSGAGAQGDADAAVGYGAGSRITDIDGKSGKSQASAGGVSGEADGGGAFVEAEGGLAGAASTAGGGAAGADDGSDSSQSGAAGSSQSTPPQLWFSEYIEGSSSNKALEITAHSRSILDGCKVSTYFNGKNEAAVAATLSGVLEAGQVLTLCTSTLKEKLGTACNQVGNLTFNGDDAVTLSCAEELLDVVGQIGVDPGAAWGGEMDSTADHTLRRACTTESGDSLGSDLFSPSPEWLVFPVDTFDGLGARGC
jgi:uncharacterized protein